MPPQSVGKGHETDMDMFCCASLADMLTIQKMWWFWGVTLILGNYDCKGCSRRLKKCGSSIKWGWLCLEIYFTHYQIKIISRVKWPSKKGWALIRVGLASLSLACLQPFLFSLFDIIIIIILKKKESLIIFIITKNYLARWGKALGSMGLFVGTV